MKSKLKIDKKFPYVIFFIGTTAEYIKLFPIIEECKKNQTPFKVVASGQNEIKSTDIAKKTHLYIDLQLTREADIVKNVFGLFSWFFKTKASATNKIKETFPYIDFEKSIMVVHGDTLSTVMGAKTGKKLKMKVAHIEAGLRSHHWFSPFPEEFDRCIVSGVSDFNFCQGEEAVKNLSKAKGKSVDTGYNTIIDALAISERIACENQDIEKLLNENYCVFVLHRQENLLQPNLVSAVVNKAVEVSATKKVVFILHQITKNTFVKMNLMNKLERENIVLFDRVEYFDFMKLLSNSDFVITDGGSNQEELHYMGKPTLIVRESTERTEGIGSNALMYKGDLNKINEFVSNYVSYNQNKIIADKSPSKIIADYLTNIIVGDKNV